MTSDARLVLDTGVLVSAVLDLTSRRLSPRRFRSRQTDAFSDRVLAALRAEFGGHAVKEK